MVVLSGYLLHSRLEQAKKFVAMTCLSPSVDKTTDPYLQRAKESPLNAVLFRFYIATKDAEGLVCIYLSIYPTFCSIPHSYVFWFYSPSFLSSIP